MVVFAGLFFSLQAWASEMTGSGDPISGSLWMLALVLVVAKIGGDMMSRLGQPAVLGELLVGIVLGNLWLFGYGGMEAVKADTLMDFLAYLGVLLLLFEVGLESTVGQMLNVGPSALAVAVLGVVAPFGLGWAVGAWLLPESSVYVHLFLGATLTATSVGITARVLQDLGQAKSLEARVILGAAVIDDVLGLVILAVVGGVITAANAGGTLSIGAVAGIIAKAAAFLIGALVLGAWWSPKLFHWASLLKARGALLATGLAFCFFLAWVAHLMGLASIVGAFAAGLILEDLHDREFTDRGEQGLEDLVRPLSSFLAPVFFVLMGARTDLRAFGDPSVWGLAGALTFVAIVGKQTCALGVFQKNVDRLTVGLGMVPRGEVGLIFAGIGLTLFIQGQPVISATTYSAVVVMVIVTTLVTPLALKWSLGRRAHRPATTLTGKAGV